MNRDTLMSRTATQARTQHRQRGLLVQAATALVHCEPGAGDAV